MNDIGKGLVPTLIGAGIVIGLVLMGIVWVLS